MSESVPKNGPPEPGGETKASQLVRIPNSSEILTSLESRLSDFEEADWNFGIEFIVADVQSHSFLSGTDDPHDLFGENVPRVKTTTLRFNKQKLISYLSGKLPEKIFRIIQSGTPVGIRIVAWEKSTGFNMFVAESRGLLQELFKTTIVRNK